MNNGPERVRKEAEMNFKAEDVAPEMAAFEAELTRALQPIEPPAGFAERVLAAAQGAERPVRAKVLPFRSWRSVVGGAIAASLLAGSFVAEDLHQRQERARERSMATQQFETATRITDEALAHTREQLERAGVLQGD